MPRPALLALSACLLATAAAAVSFAHGAWTGVVWVLLAGLTSNVAWYHLRRGGAYGRRGPVAPAASCSGDGAGCGGCVRKACP
ncbi:MULTISPECIES: hypothetical protein [unclassified Streptomyces]|uniref:hypothetical protein n=1 Tax=unclassified Streptomyces TaxID=2593676 RepID=UPI003D728A3E